VSDPTGQPVDLVYQNEKGYRKTIETGQLWALHPETGRLLPYRDGVTALIEDRGTWYVARLQAEGGSTPAQTGPAVGADMALGSARNGKNHLSDRIGEVLGSLAGVIRQRRQEMPAGSYTTHLFESGPEKIRKKAGEEAVELLLAKSREELTSETADFLYHLLVLLEAEGISLDEIADELAKR
jgi:phosphoribosyl-ATP pyrophosphohydrolase/phosphoribosyl-AMP cyclohydrolase